MAWNFITGPIRDQQSFKIKYKYMTETTQSFIMLTWQSTKLNAIHLLVIGYLWSKEIKVMPRAKINYMPRPPLCSTRELSPLTYRITSALSPRLKCLHVNANISHFPSGHLLSYDYTGRDTINGVLFKRYGYYALTPTTENMPCLLFVLS